MECYENPQQAPCCLNKCRGAEQPLEQGMLRSIQQKEPLNKQKQETGEQKVFGIFDDMLFYY